MNLHYSRLPAIVNALDSANREDKLWIGIDAKIQLPSASDLHFFDSQQDALDFQDFNRSMQKEVLLLPIISTLEFIYETADASLKNGVEHPNIILNEQEILELYEDYKFHYALSGMTEMMDTFDWSKTFYDPLEANTEAESFDDKIAFNRLEHFVEELSAFASSDERAQKAVASLLERYWKDQPMEIQIAPVLQGAFANEFNAITQSRIYSPINNQFMNMENLSYLKKNIKDTGFGESLYAELEKNIKEKKPEFQLHFTTQVGSRPFSAILDFRKSDTSEMYFFNRYRASVERTNGEKMEYTFEMRKGKGVRLNSAYNFLQGRPIKPDLINSKGESYKSWMQIDFEKRDEKGNFLVNRYSDKYGYDMRAELGRLPIKELDGGENEKKLLQSMERGYMQAVTVEINGKDTKFFVEANPARKTTNVYDEKFVMQKHESLPMAPREQNSEKHAQSQVSGKNKKKNTQSQAEKNVLKQKVPKAKRQKKGVRI